MNKLLHERLRDWIKLHGSHVKVEFENSMYMDAYIAGKLADEIERYYIPRPRFEDGEPVQFGDTAIGESVFWIVKSGADIEGQSVEEHQGKVEGYTFDDGEQPWIRIIDVEGDIIEVRPPEGSDCFKRPQLKVLDADGVEIKVEDTVWSIDENPEQFTVKEIDAPMVALYQCGSFCKWIGGTYLTHKEPDSLEKLRDDIREYGRHIHLDENWDEMTDEWVDRLSALIERGA